MEVEVPEFGYQRVARYSDEEAAGATRLRGKRVHSRDAGVVNRSLDAAAVPMSKEEYDIAMPAALASIKRLTEFAKTQPEHQAKLYEVLWEKAQDLKADLSTKYPVRIETLHRQHPDPYEERYADKAHQVLGEAKQYLFFLRFLERELEAIPEELWRSRQMRFNRRCRIERIPGSQKATIQLRTPDDKDANFVFDLKTIEGADAAGSLKRLLETYVNDNRGLLSKLLKRG